MATKNGGGPPRNRGGRGGGGNGNHTATTIKGILEEGRVSYKENMDKKLGTENGKRAGNKYEKKLQKIEPPEKIEQKDNSKTKKEKDKGKDEPEL